MTDPRIRSLDAILGILPQARELHELTEDTMDTRVPEKTREEAKLEVEQGVNDWLDDACAELPDPGTPDAARRDLTMRLAIKAFHGKAHEDFRFILNAIHALDRMNPYDPDEALFWCERMKQIAEDRMQEAQAGAAPGLYSAWAFLHQIADEEADDAAVRDAASRDPITGRVV